MGLLDFLKREKKQTVVRHTIKVMPRETLRTLAEREYGDQTKWEIIFNKNKWRFEDGDPNTIYPAWTWISRRSIRTSARAGASDH